MTARLSASQLDMNSKKIINVGAPSSPNDGARKTDVDTAYTNAISRSNHVGTQLAATISNFDAQVRTSRLDQMAVPTNPVAFNAQRATGLADPSAPQDSATKAYVDSQLAGLVSGQTLKGAVRVSTNANINIATPGATIDGVAMATGDTVLLYGQTTGSQNGPYIWNGAAVAMTRAANWDSSAEAVLGSYWIVREGSRADTFAVMSNDTAFTLGTSVLTRRAHVVDSGGRYRLRGRHRRRLGHSVHGHPQLRHQGRRRGGLPQRQPVRRDHRVHLASDRQHGHRGAR